MTSSMWARLLGIVFACAGFVASLVAFIYSGAWGRRPSWFESLFNAPVRAYYAVRGSEGPGYGIDFLMLVLCWAVWGAIGAMVGAYIGIGMDLRRRQRR